MKNAIIVGAAIGFILGTYFSYNADMNEAILVHLLIGTMASIGGGALGGFLFPSKGKKHHES